MNRNLFLAMFAAAGMLSVTSCTHEEIDAVNDSGMPQISFSIGVENTVGTRAISDGTGATKLIYAVYDADGALISTINGANNNGQFVTNNAFNANLEANVSIILAKGQTYSVVFWAQNPNCTAYNTQDLTAVTVDYNGINNDESRDAFFASVTFTVDGNKEIDVTLLRPFAQINVGVTSDDWDAAVNSGVDIASSSVVIANAANTINLLTGAVSGEEEVTYTLNTIPNETLYVETNLETDGMESYKWLSMSYILVSDATATDSDNDGTLGDERASLESLQFTFNPVSGNAITFTDGLDNVPVQRNWRTNILGNILTGSIRFNVTIDPSYVDDINKIYNLYTIDAASRTITVSDAAALLNLNNLNQNWTALFSNGAGTDYASYVPANGGKGTDYYYKWTWTINLAADIDMGGITLNAPINLDQWGTFNGGNHKISNVNIVTASNVETAAGLFDSGTCSLNNVLLDNVNVQGSFVGNSTAGILASDCNAGVNNITITNSSVNGGKYTGGVIGYGYIDITNCTLTNCTVEGGYKCGGIIGYICASSPDQLRSADGHTLTGCTVNGAGQYADGKTMYIIGKVVGNYNANGTCNDNTITNMTTTATANIGEIEAGKTVVQN